MSNPSSPNSASLPNGASFADDPRSLGDPRIRAIIVGLCIELILVAAADHDQEILQALEVLRRRFPQARVVVV